MDEDAAALRAFATELQRIDEASDYFALTLLATEDGQLHTSTQTEYAGTGARGMWELRRASLVHPVNMRHIWTTLGQRCVVVNAERSLAFFLRVGGNALVERSLFERFFAHQLEPREVVPSRFGEGVRPLKSVPKSSLKHAPSKKLRMDVLRRDGFRCRVCNRSPDDHVDIELHVHHVRPWGSGGLTEASNLLTLCSTCHQGLDPHFEFQLLGKIPDGLTVPIDTDESLREFDLGVERYRVLVADQFVLRS